jgi:hypothetical protein
MRVFLVACGLAVVACGFGACGGSAFSSGSGDDGGAGEGGGSGSSSGGLDGSSSGSESGSGSSGSDAGSSSGGEGGAGESGPGGHWCSLSPQSAMTFCADFDEQADVTAFLGTWSTFEQSGGGFKFDHVAVPSSPNALQATGGSGASVLAIKTFDALPSRPQSVRLEFALRINSAGTIGLLSAAGFAAIAYGKAIDDGYAAMAIGAGPVISAAWAAPSDAGAGDAGAYQTANASGQFPSPGTWAGRYAIEIDYATSIGSVATCVQIFQGPTPLLAHCLPLPASLGNPGVLSIAVGDLAAGVTNTGPIDLEFDDLTFNVVY